MEFEDIPIREEGQNVNVSWWNSLRTAGMTTFGETTAAIANNQSSAASITNLIFDNTLYRSAFIRYTVKRIATAVQMETGILAVQWDGTTWTIQRLMYMGTAEIDFEIDAATGQVKYTSDNMAGSYDTANSIITWKKETLGA